MFELGTSKIRLQEQRDRFRYDDEDARVIRRSLSADIGQVQSVEHPPCGLITQGIMFQFPADARDSSLL
jgi:hypothetical protein